MNDRDRGEAGRISRRDGIKLGLGGLAWAGLGGLAEARHQPPPDSLCPVAFGGSWPGTWIYYFSPCYSGNPPSCPGPYFGVTSSKQLSYGCGGGDCIGVGPTNLPPPTKSLPIVGESTAAMAAMPRDFARVAHTSMATAGPGADPLEENTAFDLQLLAPGKKVQERRRIFVKAYGRAFVCIELYFPAHTSVVDRMDYPEVTIRTGQELKRAPKTVDLQGKPVSKYGKHAHIKVGSTGSEVDYYVVGDKNKPDL